VVRREDLLAQLFLAFVDVGIQLVPVLSNAELLVIVNRDVDFSRAERLIVGVVELGHIRVAQGLLS